MKLNKYAKEHNHPIIITEQKTGVFGHTVTSITKEAGVEWPQDGVTDYDDG